MLRENKIYMEKQQQRNLLQEVKRMPHNIGTNVF